MYIIYINLNNITTSDPFVSNLIIMTRIRDRRPDRSCNDYDIRCAMTTAVSDNDDFKDIDSYYSTTGTGSSEPHVLPCRSLTSSGTLRNEYAPAIASRTSLRSGGACASATSRSNSSCI